MTGPLLIRAARQEDAKAISALILDTIKTTNAPDYNPSEVSLICTYFTPHFIIEHMQKRQMFVALQNDIIVGTVSLEIDRLHSLFVDPNHQGQQIGIQLVKHIEALACHQNKSKLTLSSSITARSFYQKLGYKELEFEPKAHGSTYLMVKTLDGS